jgi:hypothetical protein
MKLGWYRRSPGRLEISVDSALDGAMVGRDQQWSVPHGLAHVPDGYGSLGFQVGGIWFPAPGCWAITGYLVTPDVERVRSAVQFLIWVPALPE